MYINENSCLTIKSCYVIEDNRKEFIVKRVSSRY